MYEASEAVVPVSSVIGATLPSADSSAPFWMVTVSQVKESTTRSWARRAVAGSEYRRSACVMLILPSASWALKAA